ncbi:hypothetical protein DL770_011522 [Monosporascus sp. CRB-9-2]|nr:hypothetical protein DL770_011522 [Monosporascus sp. CRB-9-2]
MKAQALGHQREADHQQEAQAQHHHRAMRVDELRQRARGKQHGAHGDHHGCHHHRQVVDHAHGSDDGVDGEHRIENHHLHDDIPELAVAAAMAFVLRLAVQAFVQFGRGLEQQEEAAQQQDDRSARQIDRP